ncbi:DUF1801 domain-containing protein [Arthrobacter sp. NEB 688]|uniref:DUF1801 domain-containing protein n=1 Tax=Arthrobacter sp. NEB 688 TaxID=904039 RepID=UPI0015653623|nr:DUF1801 domain-containing protein [Arthrobacter sp. NEB 688]QKE83115.1 DUF1801 domain-containing protein [Arthrobacter sp. NEB 688]
MVTDRRTTDDGGDVDAFLASVPDERRRRDAEAALALLVDATGAVPRMWGPSIVGLGHRPYRTADGTERDWFAVGLAPRRAALVLYGLTSDGSPADLLARLGPHSTGSGCLYVKRLEAVDTEVLRQLVVRAWAGGGDGPSS